MFVAKQGPHSLVGGVRTFATSPGRRAATAALPLRRVGEAGLERQGIERPAEEARTLAVLARDLAGLHQRVRVRVPLAARIVVAEHGGRALGLFLEAERQIALDHPVQ